MSTPSGAAAQDLASAFTIGIDIGGTKIAAGVVDADGRVVARTRRETPARDVGAIADAVVDAVEELRRTHEVAAVGVAAAGFVDASRSVVTFAPNLAWRDEPVRADLEGALGLPVVVENDANAAAWGEFAHGAGRAASNDGHEVHDMVLLTIGTGLGGGIVIGDRLLRGANGFAGELGHVRVVPDGHPCGCGNRGCWEQYASGRALVREARTVARTRSPLAAHLLELAGDDPEAIQGPTVTTAAMEGDTAAIELLADLGRWIGEGAASVVAALDPALVVVGGGVSEAGDLLLGPARAAFARQLTARGHRPAIPVELATLGNDAGMIGVADLARQG
ncbi:glucokinase [Quadrisphaera granulorum]|uniref:Glucokinase n=1 Tax=Quadrisphaera granulorum TaxID=317664 RepID=A0A315ZWG3_9ACTN|nr:ROK family glucokinase [Quadrisphaera granulorum]PWJ49885.1 glucokinase [Quadrisphaera granulorum]SZE98093.1 glucokinase [Quadrisphaera granulorum]